MKSSIVWTWKAKLQVRNVESAVYWFLTYLTLYNEFITVTTSKENEMEILKTLQVCYGGESH